MDVKKIQSSAPSTKAPTLVNETHRLFEEAPGRDAARPLVSAIEDYALPFPFNTDVELNPAAVVDIDTAVGGLGLTGQLPGGAVLFATARENRAQLLRVLLDFTGGDTTAVGQVQDRDRFNFMTAQRYAGTVTRPVAVLRPGDAIAFPEVLRNGVSVYAYTPWWGCMLDPNYGYISGSPNLVVPHPRASVRIFPAPGMVPSRIGYLPTPWVGHIPGASATTPPTGDPSSPDCYCVGATHVTLHLTDNVSTPARITGGETGSYEVWWYLSNGLWAHNDADDFDAGGRGIATTTHDVETYEVPQDAVAVTVRKVSGNDFGVSFILSTAPRV